MKIYNSPIYELKEVFSSDVITTSGEKYEKNEVVKADGVYSEVSVDLDTLRR